MKIKINGKMRDAKSSEMIFYSLLAFAITLIGCVYSLLILLCTLVMITMPLWLPLIFVILLIKALV